MPLDQDEIRILAHAYALRHDEVDHPFWFASGCDTDLPTLHRLVERGYLDRGWNEYRTYRRLGPIIIAGRRKRDLVYRLSDRAMTVQEITRLADPMASSLN